MSCLLIIDDDIDSARHLAETLNVALGGNDDIVCLAGLSAYRQWRRQAHADLILVELMRQQSNGFSLAAALVRQSRTTVALLSDRGQVSDNHWAQARGIAHVLSRHHGMTALAHQISVLLGRDTDVPDGTSQAIAGLPGIDELCISPSDAMLACVYEDLRRWTPAHDSRHWIITSRQSEPLNWLKNLLPFISQSGLRDAITVLLTLSDASAGSTMRAQEQVLSYLAPTPAATLRNLLTGLAAELYDCLQSTHGISELSVLGTTGYAESYGLLLNALSFLPEAAGAIVSINPDMTVRDFILQVHYVLERSTSASTISGEPSVDFINKMKVLSALAVQPALPEACLMLATLGVQQPVRWLLDACLAQRYRVFGHDVEDSLASGQTSELWIADRLAAIYNSLTGDEALHERLSHTMVSVYKLRACLNVCADRSVKAIPGMRSWQMLAACLYDYVCHLILQPDGFTAAEQENLREHVYDLQQCAAQGFAPTYHVSVKLAAAEISFARRAQGGDGHEHQTLSAGLHRLPKPDTIVSGLLDDIRQSGSLMSEICHELQLLTTIALRLGVERVESLSCLILDCYQQISAQPDLLQNKQVRLALGQAHRVLCRLLDQAAAWRPLSEQGLQTSVSASINTLFLLFSDQQNRHRQKTSTPSHVTSGRHAGQTSGWAHCHAINSRLRQLLRRRRNPEEYRSLMLELLREQHTIIATYLPYQPPD